jgi:hypothetical protein
VVLLEAVVVLTVLGLLVYGTFTVLGRLQSPTTPVSAPGTWRTSHYDRDGETRIVLQKVSRDGARVLDEHVVTTVRIDDPEYDERFLAGMAVARQRQALFEAQDD